MTGTSLEIRAIPVSQQRCRDMPTIYHQTSPPNAMTSSFNLPPKHHQNASHIDGFFQSKEFSLTRHIESLKSAANAPILFPDLNNSGRPNGSLLSIANSGEHTDVSPLRSRPHSSSWAVDPSSVPGNLRNPSRIDKSETALTVEEILSRGSSVSEKASEQDDIHFCKSRVKARRKLNKSQKRKSETTLHRLGESPLARSSSLNTHSKLSRGTHHHSKNVDSKDLDALSTLCKGIAIQEKPASTLNAKLALNSRKPQASQSTQPTYAKSSVPTISVSKLGRSSSDTKKLVPSSDQPHPHRRKSVNKSEEIKTVKVFQSDQQSGVISDLGLAIPCAPPATPTAEQLRKYEYVPSLQDVRAQRAFRQRLQAMEFKASQKEMRKQESVMAVEKLSLKEKRQQQKKFQRQQIYALNNVMTELEHERFQTFMQGVGSG